MGDDGAGQTLWRVLGPVRLTVDGREIDLGPGRQRSVLAVLLMTPGRTVPVQTLIDRVWDDRPPRSGTAAAPYVTRLRRVIDTAAPGADLGTLRFVDGGYRLDCDPDLVDLHRARRLAAEARAALDDGGPGSAADGGPGSAAGRAADLLGRALREWQSVALAGVPGSWATRMREALHGERLDLLALRAEADLRTGRHATVIDDLSGPVAEHPTAERIVVPLLLALVRAGRSTEALATYAQVRASIADELGTEPSARLRDLHVRILRDDPTLVPPGPPTADAPGRPGDSPAQLPADVPAFTGRDEELASLDAAAAAAGEHPTAVVISAVAGTAGVGKTALAVRWAHRVRARYPDGQLYVNLRGYDPDRPMTAADALTRFLTALGVPGQDIPLDVDDRAARYRTATADRRMLILLDNASSVEQVRPLLPGTASCTVVVTSRDSLAGLAALHGAHRVHLDLLAPGVALALLRRLVGRRVDDEPGAAAELAELCVRLPLALRVAAELAAARPSERLADLVAELTDQRQRLRLLDAGDDPRAAVRTVFSWSMRHLPAPAARTFALLGLHPGPDIDAHAAAALDGTDPDGAARALEQLARANLVHRTAPRRYGMHDLLRAYAASLATADGERAALDRLFDHYLANAAAAMDSLHPADANRRPRVDAPAPMPALADPDAARGWLDAERHNLVTVVAHAAAHGFPGHAIRLSATLYRYLGGGHHGDALTVYRHARDAARQTDDPAAEAQAEFGLGAIHGRLGDYDPAIDHLGRALVLFQKVGDGTGEARALGNLGMLEAHLGRYEPASDHIQRALAVFRRSGDEAGEALALTQLGHIARRLGRYEDGVDHHERALALFRRTANAAGEAEALNGLGAVEARLGRYASAMEHHRLALDRFRQVGERTGEGWAHDGLGTAHAGLGDRDRAAEHYHEALAVFRETGDREGEAYALNGLGETARAGGDPAAAVARHTDALAAATETGGADQYARAHTGLGDAYRALGDPDRARGHYERALARYTDLGGPEAADVRARLTGCAPS
ncbi:AfsR/SARP family transcriptional regulator [Virgisporangium ochraceum]|uniref:XRE family transcriptional regulator n=1 Tax=Virgisporangium ochraceum TaxID=65505 RepID=A0A8J3ZNR4_9ACTN|nr:tetratricopeptide repeat protein [Virgisporangium ochraceum]GIJ67154.1 XRE family transcriptional regulator [Virgisporangium ochraceum]